MGKRKAERGRLQIDVHVLESVFGLSEEVVDDAPAEFALVFIIVHFENLDGVLRQSMAPCKTSY